MGTSSKPGQGRRLSVAMIVRNEQDVVAETIESVRAIADEIVVLDTGSADRTPAIAEELGARVARAPWDDDFSAARNRCLEEVTGDWVLWLDAGERLAAESADQLRSFVDREADPGKVYLLMVDVPPPNPATPSEQSARARLMPRTPDLRFEGRVRETLRPSLEAAGMEMDAAPGRILCHTRRHDPRRKAQVARRNLKIVAREKTAGGQLSLRSLLTVGEAFSDLGDHASARRAFQQAIAESPGGATETLEAHYGLLAAFDGAEDRGDEQLAACAKALEAFPLDAQLLCALGNCLQNHNRIDLASRAFDTAVRYGQIDLATWHLAEITEIAAACLGLTLQLQDKDGEARETLEQAIGQHPGSARLRRHLLTLHVKHARVDDALKVTDGLEIAADDRRLLGEALRGACAAARKDWGPALAHLQAAYVGGCEDPLCLRWLSVTLLANGQIEAVEPVLHKWRKAEPHSAEVQTYLEAVKTQREATAGTPKAPGPNEPDGRRVRIDTGLDKHGAPLQTPLRAEPSAGPSVDKT